MSDDLAWAIFLLGFATIGASSVLFTDLRWELTLFALGAVIAAFATVVTVS